MAKKGAKIIGLAEVGKNLNREIEKIKGRTMKGLILSAILIRIDMDKTPPLIPIAVDSGNLRQSWFTSPFYKGNGFGLHIGFSANYALFVHEMIDEEGTGSKINWNRPRSGPKFLEQSLKRNQKEILQIIAKHSKIK